MERREVYFSGRVQGVGFRYTTERTARSYQITGYVKNLPDGRVELIVEGESTEIDRFLEDLKRKMGGYIRDVQTAVRAPTGTFDGFSIRY
ncbi:MAG: acylphosphatase [Planctomycetota bacterium]|nr:MAG: acylphosphatase [Planctomycetota bacterium]